MNNVALFGGSFDPPHLGHEAVVKALVQLKEIDNVVIMPTFLSPFKENSFAPAKLRLRWLKEIFSSFKKVSISSFEVDKNSATPTVITVHHLLKSYDKVYVVIGADNLVSLHKWHSYNELQSLVTFIVATRENIEIPKEFLQLKVDVNISSTQVRKKLDKNKLCSVNAKEIVTYYKEKNER